MKNLPLLIAAGFTGAALVFLLWSAYDYSQAVADSEEALALWNDSAKERQALADLTANAELKKYLELQAAPPEPPDMAIEAALTQNKVELKPGQKAISESGSGENRFTTVKIADLGLETMGHVLQTLSGRSGIVIQEIECVTDPKKLTPGSLNWTLRMAESKSTAGKSTGSAARAATDVPPKEAPAETPADAPADPPAVAPPANPLPAAPAATPAASPPSPAPEARPEPPPPPVDAEGNS
jgi:hypothetical protein